VKDVVEFSDDDVFTRGTPPSAASVIRNGKSKNEESMAGRDEINGGFAVQTFVLNSGAVFGIHRLFQHSMLKNGKMSNCYDFIF
jgi:hypothetical protein